MTRIGGKRIDIEREKLPRSNRSRYRWRPSPDLDADIIAQPRMTFRDPHGILEILGLDEKQSRDRPLHAGGCTRAVSAERLARTFGQDAWIQVSSGFALPGSPTGHLGINLLPIVVGERLRALSKDENE